MANDIDLHLGKRLRRRRRLLGLTQQQLAIAVGVRFQQIQKYECGANRISAARLWRLSEALEVPVGYFYDGLTAAPRGETTGENGEVLARKETMDLVRAYYQLGERPRRSVGEGRAPASSAAWTRSSPFNCRGMWLALNSPNRPTLGPSYWKVRTWATTSTSTSASGCAGVGGCSV